MQTDQRKLPLSDNDDELLQAPRSQSPQLPDGQEDVGGTASGDSTEQPIYIMIPKTYSESVTLRDDGPQSTTEYNSSCLYKTPQTFITQADIVPRLIPKYYITIVRVDGEMEDTITYHERVEFVYTLRIREFSETVNSFAKEVSNNFVTTLTYVPNHTHRHYVTSLVMEPAQLVKLPVGTDALSSYVSKNEIAATCNGEEMLAHGVCENEQPVALLNGTA